MFACAIEHASTLYLDAPTCRARWQVVGTVASGAVSQSFSGWARSLAVGALESRCAVDPVRCALSLHSPSFRPFAKERVVAVAASWQRRAPSSALAQPLCRRGARGSASGAAPEPSAHERHADTEHLVGQPSPAEDANKLMATPPHVPKAISNRHVRCVAGRGPAVGRGGALSQAQAAASTGWELPGAGHAKIPHPTPPCPHRCMSPAAQVESVQYRPRPPLLRPPPIRRPPLPGGPRPPRQLPLRRWPGRPRYSATRGSDSLRRMREGGCEATVDPPGCASAAQWNGPLRHSVPALYNIPPTPFPHIHRATHPILTTIFQPLQPSTFELDQKLPPLLLAASLEKKNSSLSIASVRLGLSKTSSTTPQRPVDLEDAGPSASQVATKLPTYLPTYLYLYLDVLRIVHVPDRAATGVGQRDGEIDCLPSRYA
ncbi:hypothetical protein RJ55_05530 [Drechmeria coniospora]|nr:hypothetical protein RJ55_05530 [Drechmeria coniospora]